MHAVVKKLVGTKTVTKEDVMELLDLLPNDEPLVAYMASSVGSDNQTIISLVGYFVEADAKAYLTADTVDEFNMLLVQQAEKPIPPGAIKTVSVHGIKIAVKG